MLGLATIEVSKSDWGEGVAGIWWCVAIVTVFFIRIPLSGLGKILRKLFDASNVIELFSLGFIVVLLALNTIMYEDWSKSEKMKI